MTDDVAESDRALAARVSERGDERAFRVLYRRHTPALYGLVVGMLGDAHGGPDADDVVQDVWVRAVRALPAFRWECALRTWLSGIALNRAREDLRRRKRRRDDTPLDAVAAPSVAPDDPGTRIDLTEALRELPDGYRTVLMLHDWEGYTHPEISERLEISVGTSRSQLFHARRALRRLLGGEDPTP